MQEYEITYLVDPSLADDQRSTSDASVDTLITEKGGTISSNTESTRRRLQYPIEGQHVAFVRTVQASLPESKIGSLRANLAKTNGVLRATILATSHRPELSAAEFDAILKPHAKLDEAQTEKTSTEKSTKKPSKELTEEELEEQIASALDEEVK